jgi:hypothetical protein
VAECGVIGKPGRAARHDRQGVLRAAPGHAGDAELVQGAAGPCQGVSIAPYKYPREIEFVASLASYRNRQTATLQAEKTMKFLQPPGWAPAKGYSNGVAARGTQIFVGGQIGWNGQQQFETDDFIAQTARRCATSSPCCKEAGADPRRIWCA